MNSGELRHRIIIQIPSSEQNSFGEVSGVYTTFATVWAQVNPLVGKELFAAQTTGSEVTHKIKLRYMAGITPNMVVLYGVRKFTIQAVINEYEKNINLQLLCRELI